MPLLHIEENSKITETLVEALEAYQKKLLADLFRSQKNGDAWSVKKEITRENIQKKLNNISWILNEMCESGF